MSAWRSAIVGVAALEPALGLWCDRFGFEPDRAAEEETTALAALLGIGEDTIARQQRLRTGGADHGMVWLVEFETPGSPVRAGARPFDACPKNLDVYVDDLPGRLPALRAAGLAFRTEDCSEVTAPNGLTFREIHLPAHDGVNVVLIQVLGKKLPFNAHGFAGIGALVTTVRDVDAEAAYYRARFALEDLAHHQLSGPEVERMIGLPAGSGLDIRILGETGQPFGQMELITYTGVSGADLYPKAKAPATGILAVDFAAIGPTAPDFSPAGFRVGGKPASGAA